MRRFGGTQAIEEAKKAEEWGYGDLGQKFKNPSHTSRRNNVKKFLLATAMSIVCLSSAHATNYRFFCTNQSDPAINPEHDGVFVAITYGTAQSFDVVHTISRQLYNRQVQYRVTSITQPATDSYFWEGFMLKDPSVIMTGHLWQNEGVWMYTENRRFTDGRPPKMATPPVVCHLRTN